MATRLPETDVVVVGLGAAGGVAVLPLTQAGMNVVALEAGPWLTRRNFAPDEIHFFTRGWPEVTKKVRAEAPTSRPNASVKAQRARGPMMNAVGGTSVHYGALSWRLDPWDFKVVSDTKRRYGASRVPKGSTVEDWPLDYAELEPYYDKIEWEIGVSGQAGNLGGQIDPRGNPFEGPRTRGYPMPPLRSTDFYDRMLAAGKSLGWHPFQAPAAINSKQYQNRPPCMYHGFCTGGGCPVDAKNSTLVTTIPRAVATKKLKVVANAIVTRLEVDASGRVAGVTYVTDGQEYFQPAKATLLGGYVYENVRLLLLSKSKAFPNGLSNNHGQVGRHYFSHAIGGVVGVLFPWNIAAWYGLAGQSVAIDDFADDNFDHAGLDFIGGGNLLVFSDRRPITAANMNTWGAPTWGSEWKAFIKQNADRTISSVIQKTTLPYEDNYLDLDPDVKDPLGDPVIRITAEFKDNERRISAFCVEKLEQWFKAAGAVQVRKDATAGLGAMGSSTHAYGGTRMGNNPDTNVVDKWGFSHEVPNLGVLGASTMGTSGARNPTQTVQALAWRTADHLVRSWKTISKT